MQPIRTFTLYSDSDKEEICCSIYSSIDVIKINREEWDNFVQSVDGDIYLSYDWCAAWCKFYTKNRHLRIFVFRKNNIIVGLVPMFFETVRIWPIDFRLAKPIGSDFTIAIINFPVVTRLAEELFSSVFDYLLNSDGCDAVWIGPVGEKYNALQYLQFTARKSTNARGIRINSRSIYTIFNLPSTFEEYVNSLSKRQRGNLKRDSNLIEKNFKMTVDIIRDEMFVEAEFKKFIDMHTIQWKHYNKLGHFNDWPLSIKFNTKIALLNAKYGRLRMHRLILDGRVVSYQLCYAFGNKWYWRLPARLVGDEWDRYALGRIGLIKEIESAIKEEHINEIEAGPGHYEYKIKLGGKELCLYKIFLINKNIGSYCKSIIFLAFARIINYLYYRLWFCKVAPKLPFKRRSLWELWIRTRL